MQFTWCICVTFCYGPLISSFTLVPPCADPEYMAFVEHLAKPTEYLPSAEVQLERREAEKAASLGICLVFFFLVTNNAEGI